MNNNDLIEKFIKEIIKILRLKLNNNYIDLLIQITKFIIVGFISTLIDFIFLYVFRELCNLPLIISNTLSFIISVIYNYWASSTFVFNVKQEKNRKKTFIIFVLFSIIGLLLNNFIIYIVTNKLGLYYMLSKVIATIFVMIFNFITRKKFLE